MSLHLQNTMNKLIKLHELDNVQIVVEEIKAGEQLTINGMMVCFEQLVRIGHKVSEQFIASGQKIIKYGVPIGSAVSDISIGSHVHLHNMKSDYIPTYTLEEGYNENVK